MSETKTDSGSHKKGMALHFQILIAMVVGVVVGLPLNIAKAQGWLSVETVGGIASIGEAAGKIFLSLLSMVVVPLVFTSLVSSVTGLRGESNLRRLGFSTVAYYLVTSLLAITVGIIMSNVIQPGAGVDYNELMSRASEGASHASLPKHVGEESVWSVVGGIVFRMIPQNVIDSASSNRNMLAVIFFALMLGVFINKVGGDRAERLAHLMEDLYEVMMRMTHGIIQLAPYGIFGYLVFVVAGTGLELIGPLGKYMLAVFLGLIFHAFVTLPLLMYFLARRSPLELARAMYPALATAFSTASSSGTLPLTIECITERAGIQPRVASFVLPLGATINMDGTALYEAAAVLFIAQMLGDLSLGQQIIVAFTALLASVGAAGIPHAGTVMMVIVLQAVGLPTEAVLTILAVDRVLDMLRTTVNVWSDSTCTSVVAALEDRRAPAQSPPAQPTSA